MRHESIFSFETMFLVSQADLELVCISFHSRLLMLSFVSEIRCSHVSVESSLCLQLTVSGKDSLHPAAGFHLRSVHVGDCTML